MGDEPLEKHCTAGGKPSDLGDNRSFRTFSMTRCYSNRARPEYYVHTVVSTTVSMLTSVGVAGHKGPLAANWPVGPSLRDQACADNAILCHARTFPGLRDYEDVSRLA